jgi:hypothetical protein
LRSTPSQCGPHALLEHWLPMGILREWVLADRIQHGREFLMWITRQDFGHDAKRQHDRLWDTTPADTTGRARPATSGRARSRPRSATWSGNRLSGSWRQASNQTLQQTAAHESFLGLQALRLPADAELQRSAALTLE